MYLQTLILLDIIYVLLLTTEVKPEEYEKCEVDPCYDQYKWVPDGVTSCSRSCLGGKNLINLFELKSFF